MAEELHTMEALRNGDLDTFRSVVDASKDKVYNTALGLLQHTGEAEDVAQEVFVKLFENRDRLRMDASVDTWLYRVTVNAALDQLRKRKRKGFNYRVNGAAQEMPELPHFDHPGIKMENREHAMVLFNAIHQLPEMQQAVFVLHNMEGKTYREIATILKKSLTSVESLMARAKLKLQELLRNYFETQLK